MEITLLAPAFLFGLLLLPLVWFVPRRLERFGHGALRALLFAALLLALARPTLLTTDTQEHHVYVVDRSPSVSSSASDAATAALDRALDHTSSDARRVRIDVASAGEPDSRFDRTILVDGAHSTLVRALHAAADQIPHGAAGAIAVLSDAMSADPEWATLTQELTARSVRVYSVPLTPRDDAYPTSIQAVSPLRAGATAHIDVRFVGAGETTVSLQQADGTVLATAQTVNADGAATARFEFEPERPGYLALKATTSSPSDPFDDNNTLRRDFAVQDPLRVLYLGRRVTDSGPRVRELLGRGFELDVRNRIDDGGLEPSNYDLVFVDDLPASALIEPVQNQLVEAVREQGLGIAFAGGRAAFGPGGYHETPLADVMPVEFVQKEEKRDPSTTLVLIIDTSGSMGGMRVTLAKEVARLAMKRLLPHDKVGIVEFYGAKRWAAPIQPASNLIELQRALNRLDSGGGTVILPAIEEAFYGMQNVDTRYKHVLILTDGGVESGAFEPMLRKMADRGINTSTVLVGPEAHSEFLVSIANWGKGRFYNLPNRFSIPELILKQPASAQLPAYREGSHRVRARGGRGWWNDIAKAEVPPVAGYVETRPKTGAITILETRANRSPILASWRHGLGRVTAFTTEVTGPGTATWSSWREYGSWLGRVLSKTANDARSPFRYSLERRGAHAILTAIRMDESNTLPTAQNDMPGRDRAALTFRRRSLDEFEARFACPTDAAARVRCGTRGLRLCADRIVADELQVDPARAFPLSRLAQTTGGTTVTLDKFETHRIEANQARDPLSVFEFRPWLLLSTLLLYLLEVLFRRSPGYARG